MQRFPVVYKANSGIPERFCHMAERPVHPPNQSGKNQMLTLLFLS